ncbi:MAG: hypothetical protein HY787_17340 [Deltaproteobacteria bacterium]|nr:hypothetical protein [Deltaproteobacteria bacterium]
MYLPDKGFYLLIPMGKKYCLRVKDFSKQEIIPAWSKMGRGFPINGKPLADNGILIPNMGNIKTGSYLLCVKSVYYNHGNLAYELHIKFSKSK